MKWLFLFSVIFLLVSCGKVDLTIGSGVGDIKSTAPLSIDQSELARISAICQAITQKTIGLPSLVNTPWGFSYAKKECSQSSFGSASDVLTTLQNTANGYKFVQSGGNYFFFSDIETTDSGSMSKICQAIKTSEGVTIPLVSGTEYIYFKTTGIASTDCEQVSGETCVLIQRGSSDGNGNAKIHTKEWIRFDLKTAQGRYGFFTMKSTLTSYGCEIGSTIGNMATLK